MSMKNFPFGAALRFNSWQMILAYVLLIFLGGGTLTSVYAGIVLAQTPSQTVAQSVEQLAGQPIGYWLIALAIFCGSSFTLVVKWLLTQLESQRSANLVINKALMDYLAQDRLAALTELSKSNALLDEARALLESYDQAKTERLKGAQTRTPS